jgi:hypothetical protein
MLETVFNYIDAGSKSKVDVAKMFPRLIADSPAQKGYLAAQSFINAVLAGKYQPAFQAILTADNHTSFIGQAVGLMRLLIEHTIDKGLIDRQRFWMASKINMPGQAVGRTHLADYGEMLSVLLSAQQQVKGYILDAPAVLEAAALECISISHSILASKDGAKSASKMPK